jgi:hypothetical protein
VLSSGEVVFIRGRSLRIETVSRESMRHVSAPMPFQWERISDAIRIALADSLAAAAAQVNADRAKADAANATGTRTETRGSTNAPRVRLSSVAAGDLPDYRPAFTAGSAIADGRGRVWLRTTAAAEQRVEYLVFGADGDLRARVRLPPGRRIVGFDRSQRLYLSVLAEDGTAVLERTRADVP